MKSILKGKIGLTIERAKQRGERRRKGSKPKGYAEVLAGAWGGAYGQKGNRKQREGTKKSARYQPNAT